MVDQLSSQPTSPARTAFTELARTCYTFMSSRFKTKVREESSKPTLDLLTPIDKSRTGVLAEEVKEHVNLFLKQRSHFKELVSKLNFPHHLFKFHLFTAIRPLCHWKLQSQPELRVKSAIQRRPGTPLGTPSETPQEVGKISMDGPVSPESHSGIR